MVGRHRWACHDAPCRRPLGYAQCASTCCVAQVHLWELARLLEEVRAAAERAGTWLRHLVFWRDARMSAAACVLWQLACSRPRYLPACVPLLLACGLLRASHRAMRAAPEVP